MRRRSPGKDIHRNILEILRRKECDPWNTSFATTMSSFLVRNENQVTSVQEIRSLQIFESSLWLKVFFRVRKWESCDWQVTFTPTSRNIDHRKYIMFCFVTVFSIEHFLTHTGNKWKMFSISTSGYIRLKHFMFLA